MVCNFQFPYQLYKITEVSQLATNLDKTNVYDQLAVQQI